MSKPHKSVNSDKNDYNRKKDSAFEGSGADDDPYASTCGMGSWRPKWLQMFATPTYFVINFSLIGVVQSMAAVYYITCMATLEKRFAFDSKLSGLIFIADNFSDILLSPIVGYFGKRVNRARMIAAGELVIALSCFLLALPYFIYGPATHLLHDDSLLSTTLSANETRYELCPANNNDETDCLTGKYSTNWVAVVILIFGSATRGVGFTAYFVVGLPYIDDFISKNSSPLYMSFLSAVRLIGPALGYLLSSLCLSYYENPFYDPGIEPTDPRYVGAWWIGFLITGTTLTIATLPMFLFPKELKKTIENMGNSKQTTQKPKQNMKGKLAALKRMVSNPFLMLHMLGDTLRYMGTSGFFMFKAKYVESHFRVSSSSASLLTGTSSIFPMAIGCLLGGAMISRFKPRPRTLVTFIFLVGIFSAAGVFTAMFMSCPSLHMGPILLQNGSMTKNCNQGCDCTTSVFTPVCSADQSTTYFSPCFAGCHQMDKNNNTLSECSCIRQLEGMPTTGYCKKDVNNCDHKLYPYLIALTIGQIISSTAWTGSMLFTIRSVDEDDKSLAYGITLSFMALFGFIPYPIIFGAITDSACLVWESKCGKRGNCWIYDQDKFRYRFHGTAVAFMTVGSLIDFGKIFLTKYIKDFYDDPVADDSNEPTNTSKENNIIMTTTVTTGAIDSDDSVVVESF